MDFLTRDDLRALVNCADGPCISLYLPTHRAGVETLQDPIRLKNLLRGAEQRLQALGHSLNESAALVWPARELLNDYEFWQHQEDGLAIFLAAGFFRTYRVQCMVPELAVAGDRFHVKPLLAAIACDAHFYVLGLSQNRAHIYRGTQASFVELEIAGVPTSMTEALQERPVERQIQGHSAGSGHGGRLTAVLHSNTDRERKETMIAYFRQIDHALHAQFLNDPGPLILACVDQHHPLYQKVSSNPALLDTWISGNVEAMPAHEIHRHALAIATGHFRKAQKEASDQYLSLWHTQRASNKLSDILPAALQGRVASLMVPVGLQTWGHLDPTTNESVISGTPGEGDEDLLNLAAIHTYIAGGAVHAISQDQVPGGGDVAAVFRY